jgi:hypothetical protein
MKRAFVLFFAVTFFFFGGCAQQQPQPVQPVSGAGLKRIVQLDINTNQPIHSWNARAETIQQHVTPPVGISFTDADTGQKVQFDGTYKIESYRTPPAAAPSNQPKPESSPKRSPAASDNG